MIRVVLVRHGHGGKPYRRWYRTVVASESGEALQALCDARYMGDSLINRLQCSRGERIGNYSVRFEEVK